jgi:hypothetical protein
MSFQLSDTLVPGRHQQLRILDGALQLPDTLEGHAADLLGTLTCKQAGRRWVTIKQQ